MKISKITEAILNGADIRKTLSSIQEGVTTTELSPEAKALLEKFYKVGMSFGPFSQNFIATLEGFKVSYIEAPSYNNVVSDAHIRGFFIEGSSKGLILPKSPEKFIDIFMEDSEGDINISNVVEVESNIDWSDLNKEEFKVALKEIKSKYEKAGFQVNMRILKSK